MDATNVQQFDFELVSPERKLMSEKAWQVTIPGEMGNFGVRAGHSSLVSAIRPGVVEIVENEGDAPTKIFIAGGFADVTAMNCTILAEQAIKLDEMSQETIEKSINDLEGKLAAILILIIAPFLGSELKDLFAAIGTVFFSLSVWFKHDFLIHRAFAFAHQLSWTFAFILLGSYGGLALILVMFCSNIVGTTRYILKRRA